MKLNMNDELKTLVYDSMEEADSTGAIVMYKLMTNHMVLRNQKSINALGKWICHFGYRQYNSQNVKTTASQVLTVTRAMTGFRIPSNIFVVYLVDFLTQITPSSKLST